MERFYDNNNQILHLNLISTVTVHLLCEYTDRCNEPCADVIRLRLFQSLEQQVRGFYDWALIGVNFGY